MKQSKLETTEEMAERIRSLSENGNSTPASADVNGAADFEQVEPTGGFDWQRAFRYKPSQLTSDIIKTACTDANLDRNDVVSIALYLLQTASDVQIADAFRNTFEAKAHDLARSLRGG